MPVYLYRCPSNDRSVEVLHRMTESLTTWGELCRHAGLELDGTPPSAHVERVLYAPNIGGTASGPSNEELASKGFTKLVRREKGVYENVTAKPGQSRFVGSD